MSASKEYYTYHLTPNGWVEGSYKLDCGLTELPIPSDAVISITFHEELSCGFSQFHRYVTKGNVNENFSQEYLQELYRKFGRCPKGYEEYLQYLH